MSKLATIQGTQPAANPVLYLFALSYLISRSAGQSAATQGTYYVLCSGL